jgi:hypothetical protein
LDFTQACFFTFSVFKIVLRDEPDDFGDRFGGDFSFFVAGV